MEPIDRNDKGQFVKGCQTRKYRPVIGEMYGEYKVISEEVDFTKDRKIKFKVECSCGHQHSVRAYFLITGRQKMCRSCSMRKAFWKSANEGKKVGFCNLEHQGVGDITKTTYGHFKQMASRRNIEWSKDLTIEFLWKLYLNQNKKCSLSGLDIEFTEERKSSNVNFEKMTCSLDRIDSSKGYLSDNVQWVHKDVNRMKWAFEQNHFIDMCNLIVKHANQQPS